MTCSSLRRCCFWEIPSVLPKPEISFDCKSSRSHTITAYDFYARWRASFLMIMAHVHFWVYSVNAVVEKPQVLSTALDVARQITLNSPDSVQSSKEGLILAQKHHFEEAVRTHALSAVSKRLYNGQNIKVSRFHLRFPC